MNDLVKRLRDPSSDEHHEMQLYGPAADEIERLQFEHNAAHQEAAELREQLATVMRERDELEGLLRDEQCERMRLAEKLAALNEAKEVEPVCYLREEWLHYEQSSKADPHAFPVFTHPAHAVPEGLDMLRSKVIDYLERMCGDRCNAENNPCEARELWKLLTAEPAVPEVKEGWQPIETAPKDGTYVMVGNDIGVWVASYCAAYQSGFRPDNPWMSLFLNHDHIQRKQGKFRSSVPTHWMPLPAAPKHD